MCHGFQQNERDRRLLQIKAFYLLLSVSKSPKPFPDSLTLHYLPRINGGSLEINEASIRSDSPAFVTLYRVMSADNNKNNSNKCGKLGSVFYGSRERVRVSEGVRFEVYLREEKVLKGSFRKDEEGEWKMDCKCGLELEGDDERADMEVKHVEVCVSSEGEAEVMKEKVEMVVRRKKRRCFEGLEEIPEQSSEGEDEECCCCCDCGGEEEEEEGGCSSEEEAEVEAEVEGVRWAVDVGIWVMCLGVGYLVSKASSKSLIRRKTKI